MEDLDERISVALHRVMDRSIRYNNSAAMDDSFERIKADGEEEIRKIFALEAADQEAKVEELSENPPDVEALLACVEALKGKQPGHQQRVIGALVAFFPRMPGVHVSLGDMWVEREPEKTYKRPPAPTSPAE